MKSARHFFCSSSPWKSFMMKVGFVILSLLVVQTSVSSKTLFVADYILTVGSEPSDKVCLQLFKLHFCRSTVQADVDLKVFKCIQCWVRIFEGNSTIECRSIVCDLIWCFSCKMFPRQISFEWHFIIYKNWRQLLKTSDFDLCQLFSFENNQPFLQGYLKNVQMKLTKIPLRCPMPPGRYYNYNITYDGTNSEGVHCDFLIST